MTKINILFYGFIIAFIIIIIWLIYAYYYRTSIIRLSKLAGQKYLMLVSTDIQNNYIVQCDPNLSYIDSNGIFNAFIKFTSDIDHPNAPLINSVIKKYTISYDSSNCDPNNLIQYIDCINVN